MANWYNEQLTNKNYLSPIGFVFILDKARRTSFLCQRAEIPDIRLGAIPMPTRGMVTVPLEGNMEYGTLNIDFLVDEDLRNYMELHNWIRALGTPQDYQERVDWVDKYSAGLGKNADTKTSDATLQVLNNNNIVNFDVVFKDLFPVSLSTVNFDVTQDDNNYFTAQATFDYVLYEVRNKNSQTRR
tara:strand:+ start:579 stop:1133 length:555 start_codon:yes stop_codon:yes gene_type:complete